MFDLFRGSPTPGLSYPYPARFSHLTPLVQLAGGWHDPSGWLAAQGHTTGNRNRLQPRPSRRHNLIFRGVNAIVTAEVRV